MGSKRKAYSKEVYRTRKEWLKQRGIGGSSASAVINESKWQTPLDVYNTIKSTEVKEEQPNHRMIVGTLAEEHIRELFALEHPQFKVIAPPKRKHWLFRRKDYPLITLTPDGLFQDKETKEMYGLEIKHVELRNRKVREEWENNILPSEYYYQCLHYMVVMEELKAVWLVARLNYFRPSDEDNTEWQLDYVVEKTIIVNRSDFEKEIETLKKGEIDFIENYINKNELPPMTMKF